MGRYLVIFSFIALSVLGVFSQNEIKISCSAWMRCSSEPENTYGLIGKKCGIWRNPCLLSLDNCDRKTRNETLITPTTKEECVRYCPSVCPFLYMPICGEYMNEKRIFSNDCSMKSYNCQKGKTFLLKNYGECE